MKKIIALFIALMLLAFGLCSCKKDETEETEPVGTEAEVNDNEFGKDNEAYYNEAWAK